MCSSARIACLGSIRPLLGRRTALVCLAPRADTVRQAARRKRRRNATIVLPAEQREATGKLCVCQTPHQSVRVAHGVHRATRRLKRRASRCVPPARSVRPAPRRASRVARESTQQTPWHRSRGLAAATRARKASSKINRRHVHASDAQRAFACTIVSATTQLSPGSLRRAQR